MFAIDHRRRVFVDKDMSARIAASMTAAVDQLTAAIVVTVNQDNVTVISATVASTVR